MPTPADKVPTVKLGETIVFDSKRQHQVMFLEGIVVLPVGSTVQLGNPNVDAIVVGIRLWGSNPASVILDCDVPAEYWGDSDEPRPLPPPKLRLI
jgi:hypothetical protein